MTDFTTPLREIVFPALLAGAAQLAPDIDTTSTHATALKQSASLFIEAYPLQWHTHFEWFWVLSGTALMKVEDEVYALEPGSGCLLAPHVRHTDVYNPESLAYTSLWFSYRPEMLGVHLFSYEPVGQWRVLAYDDAPAPPQVGAVLLALQSEIQEQRLHRNEVQHGLLLQLVGWLIRALGTRVASASDKRLPGTVSRRVLHYLQQNYTQDVALQDVARAVHFSPTYLASVFKQETGETIFEALTRIRLEHARHLLLQGVTPIHEVAASVGYSDPHHFSRVFSRHVGMPPSRYGK